MNQVYNVVPTPPNPKELADFMKKHPKVRHFEILIPDINGVIRGRLGTKDIMQDLYRGNFKFTQLVYITTVNGSMPDDAGSVIEDGDPNVICYPVPGTLALSPWEEDTAQVIVDLLDWEEDKLNVANPRATLIQLENRLKKLGIYLTVAFEYEFYLFDNKFGTDGKPQKPWVSSTQQRVNPQHHSYLMDVMTSFKPFLDEVMETINIQGFACEGALAECSPGQMELNLRYVNSGIRAADEATMFKYLIRRCARKKGYIASFMAKPEADLEGSGCHVHIGVYDKNKVPLMNDPEKRSHIIGGVLKTMAESYLIFCPHINSYKRTVPNFSAPVAANWGYNNRSVSVRIPSDDDEPVTRFEHRLAGADSNPYWVLSAILMGILYGLENKVKAPKASEGEIQNRKIPRRLKFPQHMYEATLLYKKSKIIRHYFGKDVQEIYTNIKEHELRDYVRPITPHEIQWYLTSV